MPDLVGCFYTRNVCCKFCEFIAAYTFSKTVVAVFKKTRINLYVVGLMVKLLCSMRINVAKNWRNILDHLQVA